MTTVVFYKRLNQEDILLMTMSTVGSLLKPTRKFITNGINVIRSNNIGDMVVGMTGF
jgi:hypothetical protein